MSRDSKQTCAPEAKRLLIHFYVETQTVWKHTALDANWKLRSFCPFSVTHVIHQVEFYASCVGKKICGYGGEICGHMVFLCLQDFEANEDLNSIVHHSLITYEEARYVRFHPTSYSTWPCVRVEIYVIS